MKFSPSPQQVDAIAAIQDWFRNRKREQQVFRLFGYAGTGKTSLTRHAISELGLAPMKRNGSTKGVLYAAYTGKAALVMTCKGTPASTIHSLIYHVSDLTPEEIDKLKTERSKLRASLRTLPPFEREFAEIRLRRLEHRLNNIYQPQFVLNEQSRVRDADLIVLDEVSMVGHQMATDLLSFGRPILVLGDPGQLPPIQGEGAFTDAKPDVMLTEIHRQAETSAIIRLATMARQGEFIPYGEYDEAVWKMRRGEVGPDQLLKGGQVICGRNETRRHLNTAMKEAAGFDAVYPQGSGEKIICLKNRHDLGLVNGMFLHLEEVRDEGPLAFSALVRTEDGDRVAGRQRVYRGHYDDHVAHNADRLQRDYRERKRLIESDWGYAITCHKAQGSQWENVIVYDDGLIYTPEDRARWLYTAITRAERGLVLLQ